jgi:hypothetical protein
MAVTLLYLRMFCPTHSETELYRSDLGVEVTLCAREKSGKCF